MTTRRFIRSLPLLALMLTACASSKGESTVQSVDASATERESPSGDEREPVVVRLRFDEKVPVGELTLELVDVADSRCPDGVNCVWAGDVRVAVRITRVGKKTVALKLTAGGSGSGERTVAGHTFRLVGVEPYPQFGSKTADEDYVVALSVE